MTSLGVLFVAGFSSQVEHNRYPSGTAVVKEPQG
jgi:hypothetical protein